MSHARFVLRALVIASAVTVLMLASASIGAQAPRTVQDGVFSDAQATRGQALYTQRCAGCHGPELAGAQAPPLAGAAFRSKWRKEPLSGLFIKIRYTMPPNAADAAKLTPDQGADLVAHVLKSNAFPAGTSDFPAKDATASTIGWPVAPAGEEPAATAVRYVPAATLNQLMRGVFFPNSNLIFTIQEVEAEKIPPQPSASKPEGLTIFEWGLQIYTGWPVVENAAASLADASTLMLTPGLRCENGRLAPVTEPDWIRFTDQMIAIAKRTYRLAQTRDKEAVSDFTLNLSNACNACHGTYRDVGRGRGANAAGGANAPTGPNSSRCMHR
jgi:mono/diheme cytochrome c family protein